MNNNNGRLEDGRRRSLLDNFRPPTRRRRSEGPTGGHDPRLSRDRRERPIWLEHPRWRFQKSRDCWITEMSETVRKWIYRHHTEVNNNVYLYRHVYIYAKELDSSLLVQRHLCRRISAILSPSPACLMALRWSAVPTTTVCTCNL